MEILHSITVLCSVWFQQVNALGLNSDSTMPFGEQLRSLVISSTFSSAVLSLPYGSESKRTSVSLYAEFVGFLFNYLNLLFSFEIFVSSAFFFFSHSFFSPFVFILSFLFRSFLCNIFPLPLLSSILCSLGLQTRRTMNLLAEFQLLHMVLTSACSQAKNYKSR